MSFDNRRKSHIGTVKCVTGPGFSARVGSIGQFFSTFADGERCSGDGFLFSWKRGLAFLLAAMLLLFSESAVAEVPTPDAELRICGPEYGDKCVNVFVVLADDNEVGSVLNPVIILEGWDGENKHSFKSLWNRLGGGDNDRLFQRLLERGQDVILVDWADPRARIQDNGAALSAVLDTIGKTARENNPTCAEPVVIGTSMGGLVARWALMDWEYWGEHFIVPIRSFISLDVPHRGVNSPLAMQALAKEFKFIPDIEAMWTDITRGSARQLFVSHIQGDGYAEHKDRIDFMNELRDMGNYPEELRNVAIANGSCTGKSQGYNGGDLVATMKVPVWAAQIALNALSLPNLPIVDYQVKLFAYPDPNEGKEHVYRSRVSLFSGIPWWPIVITDNQYYPRLKRSIPSYDVVPGGKWDYWKDLEENMWITEFIFSREHDHACAVPTISALDLDTNDYYYDIYNDPLDYRERTPFNEIYCEHSENQSHVSFDMGIVNYLVQEIAPDYLELCGEVESGEVDKRASVDTIAASPRQCGYVVENGAEVELTATNSIKLSPGFHAEKGSRFRARIGSCGSYDAGPVV